jgi:hypothetical protein
MRLGVARRPSGKGLQGDPMAGTLSAPRSPPVIEGVSSLRRQPAKSAPAGDAVDRAAVENVAACPPAPPLAVTSFTIDGQPHGCPGPPIEPGKVNQTSRQRHICCTSTRDGPCGTLASPFVTEHRGARCVQVYAVWGRPLSSGRLLKTVCDTKHYSRGPPQTGVSANAFVSFAR